MDSIYYMVLLSICLLLGLTVIYQALAERLQGGAGPFWALLFRRRQSNTTVNALSNENQNVELQKFRDANKRLTENIHRLEEENNSLMGRICNFTKQNETLAKHNEELQEINRHLAEEKEKLYLQKKRLEELHKKKDELFAITIHDLKNPAGALKGFVDILRTYELTAAEQQSIVEHITDLTARIVSITQSISGMLAQEEETHTFHMALTPLKPIIDEVCLQNKAYAESKKVQITNNSSPDTPPIYIDAFKIERAIGNLVDNAIKFAHPDTVVRITSYFDAKNIILEISDNGIGMNPDDISKAFNRGVTLSAQPTGNENSTGLGLWIVKQIIEGHGGSIQIDSRVEFGTKFIIRLPIRAAGQVN